MDDKKYTLTWHTYTDHLREMMHNMMTSKDFADVTLVCDDKKTIRAHRNILSACSPVFKDILQMSTQSNHPVIYLRGMQSSEIESILQFMYFGEAKFYKERMDEYLSVVKELEIKELSKAVDTSDQQPDYTPDEAIEESEKDCNESTENYATDDDIITGYEAEIVGSDNEQTEAGKPNSCESKFQCKQCHKTYSDLSGLWYYKKSKHEGAKYACNQCDYQATTQQHLRTHIQSVHEGVKYNCNQCDQQFTQQGNLQQLIFNMYNQSSTIVISVTIKLQHRVILKLIFNLNMKVSSMHVTNVTFKLQHRIT